MVPRLTVRHTRPIPPTSVRNANLDGQRAHSAYTAAFAFLHILLHAEDDLRVEVARRANLVYWELRVHERVRTAFLCAASPNLRWHFVLDQPGYVGPVAKNRIEPPVQLLTSSRMPAFDRIFPSNMSTWRFRRTTSQDHIVQLASSGGCSRTSDTKEFREAVARKSAGQGHCGGRPTPQPSRTPVCSSPLRPPASPPRAPLATLLYIQY